MDSLLGLIIALVFGAVVRIISQAAKAEHRPPSGQRGPAMDATERFRPAGENKDIASQRDAPPLKNTPAPAVPLAVQPVETMQPAEQTAAAMPAEPTAAPYDRPADAVVLPQSTRAYCGDDAVEGEVNTGAGMPFDLRQAMLATMVLGKRGGRCRL